MPEQFQAHAQYDDWKGTVAADDADNLSVQQFFRDKGVDENAYVVGLRMFEQSSNRGRPWVRAIVADGHGYDDVNAQISQPGTLRFKEVDIELTFEEFFSMFKRFSVVLSRRGLGLEGRDYEIIDED
jgi:hypothetical protein